MFPLTVQFESPSGNEEYPNILIHFLKGKIFIYENGTLEDLYHIESPGSVAQFLEGLKECASSGYTVEPRHIRAMSYYCKGWFAELTSFEEQRRYFHFEKKELE